MSTLTTSKKPTDLIIVCCHGIWLGPSFDEKYWLIQDFQRGETETFIEHIKIGLRQLVESNENGKDATLMFSGGPTRKETIVSEARSYLALAHQQSYFDILPPKEIASYRSLIFAESWSLDSFDNVSLPTCAFQQLFRKSPEKVTVVSHEFKRARFEDIHFKVLGGGQYEFVGKDPEYMVTDPEGKRAKSVREAELRNGYDVWKKDMRGQGEELLKKRNRRDPWKVGLLDEYVALESAECYQRRLKWESWF